MPAPPIARTAPDPRRLGLAAERLAAAYLEERGLTVIARNFRCRLGELDLVCADGAVLAVIEVRQRSSARYGGALGSITAAKRRRIARATAVFLRSRPRWRGAPVRFDVIGIDGDSDSAAALVWVRGAF